MATLLEADLAHFGTSRQPDQKNKHKKVTRSSQRTCLNVLLAVLTTLLLFTTGALAQSDPLPSWNDGPAKQAIAKFVQTTTDKSDPKYVAPENRIATFDQDGTLWVEPKSWIKRMNFDSKYRSYYE